MCLLCPKDNNFRVTQAEGKRYVRKDFGCCVQYILPARCADQCRLSQIREDVDGNIWLEVKTTHKLLIGTASAPAASSRIGGLLRAIKNEEAGKRKHARKHRWLVAYRQNYACFDCKQLLHPDAWECDHHVELLEMAAPTLFPGWKRTTRGVGAITCAHAAPATARKPERERGRSQYQKYQQKINFRKYFAHA